MGFAATLGHRSLIAFGNPRVAPRPCRPVTTTASPDKSELVALPVTKLAADLQEEMEVFDVFGHGEESQ